MKADRNDLKDAKDDINELQKESAKKAEQERK